MLKRCNRKFSRAVRCALLDGLSVSVVEVLFAAIASIAAGLLTKAIMIIGFRLVGESKEIELELFVTRLHRCDRPSASLSRYYGLDRARAILSLRGVVSADIGSLISRG